MNTLEEMASALDAGNVIIPVWNTSGPYLFRNDKGQYILSAYRCFYTADTMAELYSDIQATASVEEEQSAQMDMLRSLVSLPTWQAIDTMLPANTAPGGVSLLSLRKELESGQVVSPMITGAVTPYCIRKSGDYFIEYTPDPCNDVTATYASVDELSARNFHAHFPIWIVGESPAYQAMEAEFHRQDEERRRESEAIDAAPPRMVELTEREYRELLAAREYQAEAAARADEDPFLPDFPDDL